MKSAPSKGNVDSRPGQSAASSSNLIVKANPSPPILLLGIPPPPPPPLQHQQQHHHQLNNGGGEGSSSVTNNINNNNKQPNASSSSSASASQDVSSRNNNNCDTDLEAEDTLIVKREGVLVTDLLYRLHRRSTKLIDTHVICSDGYIPVHRCVLMASSKFLMQLLMLEDPAELVAIHLPDFKVSQVIPLMNSFYTGCVIFNKEDLTTIIELINLLKAEATYNFQPAKEHDKKWCPKMRHYLEHKEIQPESQSSAPESSSSSITKKKSRAPPSGSSHHGKRIISSDDAADEKSNTSFTDELSPDSTENNPLIEVDIEEIDDPEYSTTILDEDDGAGSDDDIKILEILSGEPVISDVLEVEVEVTEKIPNFSKFPKRGSQSSVVVNKNPRVAMGTLKSSSAEASKDDLEDSANDDDYDEYVFSPTTLDIESNVIMRQAGGNSVEDPEDDDNDDDDDDRDPLELECLLSDKDFVEEREDFRGRSYEFETIAFDETGQHKQIAQILTEPPSVPLNNRRKNRTDLLNSTKNRSTATTTTSKAKKPGRKASAAGRRRTTKKTKNPSQLKRLLQTSKSLDGRETPPPLLFEENILGSETPPHLRRKSIEKLEEQKSRMEDIRFSNQLQKQLQMSLQSARKEPLSLLTPLSTISETSVKVSEKQKVRNREEQEEALLKKFEEEKRQREEDERLQAQQDFLKQQCRLREEYSKKSLEEQNFGKECERGEKERAKERKAEELQKHHQTQEKSIKEQEMKRLKAQQERSVKEMEEMRLRNLEEERAKAEQVKLLKAEQEKSLKAAEEDRRWKAKEAKRLKIEEAKLLKAEEEKRLRAEEAKRLQVAEEKRLRVEEEKRLKAEEEKRLKAEEEMRLKAEEEKRLKAEEAKRLQAEETKRLQYEEEKRLRAEEEKRLKDQELRHQKALEEKRVREQEEEKRRKEKERRKKVEEEKRRKEQEEARLRKVEEDRIREEERKRKEARLREEKRLAEEEELRKQKRDEEKREAEAQRRREKEDERRREKEEERRREKEEERRREKEEERRREKEARRKKEEEKRLAEEERLKQIEIQKRLQAEREREEEEKRRNEEVIRIEVEKAEEDFILRQKLEMEKKLREEQQQEEEDAQAREQRQIREQEERKQHEEQERVNAEQREREKVEEDKRIEEELELQIEKDMQKFDYEPSLHGLPEPKKRADDHPPQQPKSTPFFEEFVKRKQKILEEEKRKRQEELERKAKEAQQSRKFTESAARFSENIRRSMSDSQDSDTSPNKPTKNVSENVAAAKSQNPSEVPLIELEITATNTNQAQNVFIDNASGGGSANYEKESSKSTHRTFKTAAVNDPSHEVEVEISPASEEVEISFQRPVAGSKILERGDSEVSEPVDSEDSEPAETPEVIDMFITEPQTPSQQVYEFVDDIPVAETEIELTGDGFVETDQAEEIELGAQVVDNGSPEVVTESVVEIEDGEVIDEDGQNVREDGRNVLQDEQNVLEDSQNILVKEVDLEMVDPPSPFVGDDLSVSSSGQENALQIVEAPVERQAPPKKSKKKKRKLREKKTQVKPDMIDLTKRVRPEMIDLTKKPDSVIVHTSNHSRRSSKSSSESSSRQSKRSPSHVDLNAAALSLIKNPKQPVRVHYEGRPVKLEIPTVTLTRLSSAQFSHYEFRLKRFQRMRKKGFSPPPPMLTKAGQSTLPPDPSLKAKGHWKVIQKDVTSSSKSKNVRTISADDGLPPLLEPQLPIGSKNKKSSKGVTTPTEIENFPGVSSQPAYNSLYDLASYQKELKRCAHCKTSYPTHNKATSCLLNHGFRRCLICMDLVSSIDTSYELHYAKHHAVPKHRGHVGCPLCGQFLLYRGLQTHVTRKHLQPAEKRQAKTPEFHQKIPQHFFVPPPPQMLPEPQVEPLVLDLKKIRAEAEVPSRRSSSQHQTTNFCAQSADFGVQSTNLIAQTTNFSAQTPNLTAQCTNLSAQSTNPSVRLSESEDDEDDQSDLESLDCAADLSKKITDTISNGTGSVLKDTNQGGKLKHFSPEALYSFKEPSTRELPIELVPNPTNALVDSELARRAFQPAELAEKLPQEPLTPPPPPPIERPPTPISQLTIAKTIVPIAPEPSEVIHGFPPPPTKRPHPQEYLEALPPKKFFEQYNDHYPYDQHRNDEPHLHLPRVTYPAPVTYLPTAPSHIPNHHHHHDFFQSRMAMHNQQQQQQYVQSHHPHMHAHLPHHSLSQHLSMSSHLGDNDGFGSNPLTVDESSGSVLCELQPVNYHASPIPLQTTYSSNGPKGPSAVPAPMQDLYDSGGPMELSRPNPSIFATPPPSTTHSSHGMHGGSHIVSSHNTSHNASSSHGSSSSSSYSELTSVDSSGRQHHGHHGGHSSGHSHSHLGNLQSAHHHHHQSHQQQWGEPIAAHSHRNDSVISMNMEYMRMPESMEVTNNKGFQCSQCKVSFYNQETFARHTCYC